MDRKNNLCGNEKKKNLLLTYVQETSNPRGVDYVIDTSALVSFSGIGRLDLLQQECGVLAVPEAVRIEIVEQGEGWLEAEAAQKSILEGSWLKSVKVKRTHELMSLRTRLGKGESECIEYARTKKAIAIIDDCKARNEAKQRGIITLGRLGILAKSKYEGRITLVTPLIEAMKSNGIRFADELIRKFLIDIGEAP